MTTEDRARIRELLAAEYGVEQQEIAGVEVEAVRSVIIALAQQQQGDDEG